MGRKDENLKGDSKSSRHRTKLFFMNHIQGKILTHLENWQGLVEVLLCPVEGEGDVRSSFTKIVGAAPVKQKNHHKIVPQNKHSTKSNIRERII